MANPSIHYIGSNVGTLHNHASCERVWQGIIRQHTGEYKPPPAYNFGLCNDHGIRMEGRGWDRDSAANGPGGNRGSRALCVLVGPDDVINNVCRQAISRWAHEAVRNHGLAWPLRPHSSYVATACPGDRLRAVINDINAGIVVPDEPAPVPDDTNLWEEDVMLIINKTTNAVAIICGNHLPQKISSVNDYKGPFVFLEDGAWQQYFDNAIKLHKAATA